MAETPDAADESPEPTGHLARLLRRKKDAASGAAGAMGAAAVPSMDAEGSPPAAHTPGHLERLRQRGHPIHHPPVPKDRHPEAEHALREAQIEALRTLTRVPEEEQQREAAKLARDVWEAAQCLQSSSPSAHQNTAESIAQSLLAATEARGGKLEQQDVTKFFAEHVRGVERDKP